MNSSYAFRRTNKFCSSIFTLLVALLPSLVWAELNLHGEYVGSYYTSADGRGTVGSNSSLRVEKRTGDSKIVEAILIASSSRNRVIENGDVQLNGVPITWSKTVFSNAGDSRPSYFNNVFSDVTDIVQPVFDAGVPGIVSIDVLESDSSTIEGTALFVVLEDSAEPLRTIVLYTGAQSTNGDTFDLALSRPVVLSDDVTMGLGIAFSLQGSNGTDMVNIIDVNGTRLTSSAGGEDDGASIDGALITVGGIGDVNENPDSNAPSTGASTDDELYQLVGLIGDTQNISVRSVNPTEDDNIFMAYFEVSALAEALPVVEPPQSAEINGVIDPTLPTIILTHGLSDKNLNIAELWTGFNENQAGELITSSFGADKVNIVQYVWEDAFHFSLFPTRASYTKARNNTFNAGKNLQKKLMESLGASYDGDLHFVGHSLGTIVNAFAVAGLPERIPNVRNIQVTALDRPDDVTKIPGITDSSIVRDGADEVRLGFDENFFAVTLPMNNSAIDLKVDNYFTRSGSGVGDEANGSKVYNHPNLVAPDNLSRTFDAGFTTDHSGVQLWYRWTIAPNSFNTHQPCEENGSFNRPPTGNILFPFEQLDQSLSPCNSGWSWSITQNYDDFPIFNGMPVLEGPSQRVIFSNVAEYGCSIETGRDGARFICSEQSSPFIAADVSIPVDANYISFDYEFTSPGDGDYAAISLNNETFWILEGSTSEGGSGMQNTGPLQLPILANNPRIKIALYGVNDKNAEIVLDNFQFITALVDDNPDSDGDGVPNSDDVCPNTGTGTDVDVDGCPVPPIEIPDEQLLECINTELGNQTSATPTISQLESISILDCGFKNINNIDGIDNLRNLERLVLSGNQISDLVPLSELSALELLWMRSSNLADISAISGLTKLTSLELSNNDISDISAISGMINLRSLNLSDNAIENIQPLRLLNGIEFLDLSFNEISDISDVSSLVSLIRLDLSQNNISNIYALQGLTLLTHLNLWKNEVQDINPLQYLINLEEVSINQNDVTDISPLFNLSQLKEVDVFLNCISDFSGLSGQVEIKGFDAQRAETDCPTTQVKFEGEVNLISSCLAGRGRVDLNIVNNQTASSVYGLEFGSLPARQTTVSFEDWGRLSVAGRLPNTYPAVVKRDGVEILNTDVTIDCSVASPLISTQEVSITSACRGSMTNKGQVFFQLVNPTSSARTYVIEFDNVPNRARNAAAFGQARRGTAGRPDGTYDYRVRTGFTEIDSGQVTVDCN